MTQVCAAGPMWARISESQVNERTTADLRGFRSSEVNYRISLVDVKTNGVRYLKTLLYNLASGLSEENWRRLRQVRGRELGAPVSVT